MSATAYSKIMRGTADDLFAHLGPRSAPEGRRLTAFAPGAAKLSADIGGASIPLKPVEGAPEIFVGELPREGRYRLTKTAANGHTQTYRDPYSFGPVLGEMDEYLIGEGTHARLWEKLGAHVVEHEGVRGTHFAIWAPNARRVSVVGNFNDWDGRRDVMRKRGASGVWEIFLPDLGEGTVYKYEIVAADGTVLPLKADPVGFGAQHPPQTASVVRDIAGYGWHDAAWMQTRAAQNSVSAPISIYEVHLGSWRRDASQNNRPISYKEAAEELVDYAADMGFTHIELLPIAEHPFDGSWGYQPTGLFAPTVRHGPPHEFRDLIDAAHRKGLGVLLDWVPAHFPSDAHGLGQFDGTALYEHADPREGFHKDWNTLIYNFGRTEVQNFLVANARYWLEEYHIDGLRVDAVASMLYRDYSRDEGEWIPNKDGGRENYEAIALLQRMNTEVYGDDASVMTVAEESTAFPGVSRPVSSGGLGFGFKWNMGWMHDTLDYIQKDPVYRRHHHNKITFGLTYAFSENFILPISHDEVVHGKGSMLGKMPGDAWQKFANLRAYYGLMWGHPGKKLLFMGQEFGQVAEWNHNGELDWAALDDPRHAGLQNLVRDLNRLYRDTPALHRRDTDPAGFEWILGDAADQSVFAWIRRGDAGDPPVAVICNFTPVPREGMALGLPEPGAWQEVLNTDAEQYGGTGMGNMGRVLATGQPLQGQPASAKVTLPPLSVVMLRADRG
ncbi:1,4-alpha-glucan (glycogen) branching enzyme, GH-13-type [Rhodovulum sp. P5]|uniref:1,4-alpha-glucan branching protein GlgB n=1 Tax=Rhodovulum sp. P5 TaxID=1564506 RepID=UPI0009C24D8E|nr:1,4-alpha-glucan branching protein GlgB [Rhodovulum sp. P5]ARE40538.1 1,4-alpha-glucan (glycogen) branching enzyme, GH-13-type [Rhodovulum sp. P5]